VRDGMLAGQMMDLVSEELAALYTPFHVRLQRLLLGTAGSPAAADDQDKDDESEKPADNSTNKRVQGKCFAHCDLHSVLLDPVFVLQVEHVLPGVADVGGLDPQGGEVAVLPAAHLLLKHLEPVVLGACVEDHPALASLQATQLPGELGHWVRTELDSYESIGSANHRHLTALHIFPGLDTQDLRELATFPFLEE